MDIRKIGEVQNSGSKLGHDTEHEMTSRMIAVTLRKFLIRRVGCAHF